ncbi:uncharacterized protein LY89DRAFT_563532, partial [Mollisia scopiformis]
VLDALDEFGECLDLMELIQEINEWNPGAVSILATSRRYPEIEEEIIELKPVQINIQSSLIDSDIRTYIQTRLQGKGRLRRWCRDETIKSKIQQTLVEGAKGMFRWVACQMDELDRCLTLGSLETTMKSLPDTLDKTYERILLGIDKRYKSQALTALRWLAFAMRPLTIREVAEAVHLFSCEATIGDVGDESRNRLSDPNDILLICSGLITITEELQPDADPIGYFPDISEPDMRIIQLSHFSVKEYVVSDHAKLGPASHYHLVEPSCHTYITHCCVSHLLQYRDIDSL